MKKIRVSHSILIGGIPLFRKSYLFYRHRPLIPVFSLRHMSPVFGPCLIFQIAGYCRLDVHRLAPIVPVLSMISVAFYSGISVYFSLWFNIFPRLELFSGGSPFYGDSHARRIQQKK
ncbi:hypothetical protein HMPREF1986_00474 [Oribacterium sp. oral taxon 078 str. F0263]|nr:hypothetical protein HMPREF1986_00474 [Oribacterium sp. oral taxon 078 str. F0263]